MLTLFPLALKLKAWPTSPFAYTIPNGVVPLFVPALSKALPSARHQPTSPAGAGRQFCPLESEARPMSAIAANHPNTEFFIEYFAAEGPAFFIPDPWRSKFRQTYYGWIIE